MNNVYFFGRFFLSNLNNPIVVNARKNGVRFVSSVASKIHVNEIGLKPGINMPTLVKSSLI